MVVDLFGAVLGWLTAEAGARAVDGGRRLMVGDPHRRALRRVVRDSVALAVDEIGLPEAEAARLRAALLTHSVPVRRMRGATAGELGAAVTAWVESLDRDEWGSGHLIQHGVDPSGLAGELATGIVRGIKADARAGGPLALLADWLWRDDATRLLESIEERVAGWELTNPGPPGRKLPGTIVDFTGRDIAVADLHARLRRHDPDGTVVAIHAVNGMGGVGKTTLAVKVALEVAGRYPDGCFFIDLHGFTAGIAPLSPQAALEQLLRDAGVPANSIPADLAARQVCWRSVMAGRRAMVVLDNALDSAQVRPLLPGAPGCLVLITGRRRLSALPEVDEVLLGVMTQVEAEEMFLRVTGPDRVDDRRQVGEVVRLCGFLPLAVRIVAARLRREPGATLAAVAAELSRESGRLMQLSPEDAGVTGALHVSMARLSDAQRRVVWYVGLHPGPRYAPPAIAQLAGLPEADAYDLLRALADHHLIEPAPTAGPESAYECHDLVRDYAQAEVIRHLHAVERAAAYGRLTAWYRRMLEIGTHRWLAEERDNLLAFGCTSTGPRAISVGLDAAKELSVLGFYGHAHLIYAHVYQISVTTGDLRNQAAAAFGLADLARLTFADLGSTLEQYQQAHALYRTIGDRAGQAMALIGVAHVARFTGDEPAALRTYRQAADTFAEIGDPRGQAHALWGLATVCSRLGELDRARSLFEQALALDLQIGYWFGQSEELRGMGILALRAGDPSRARTHHQDAYDLCDKIGYRRGQAHNLLGLGRIAHATGDTETARHLMTQAMTIYDELGLALAANARQALAALDAAA